MNQLIKRITFLSVFLITVFFIHHCGDDAINAPQDFIKGTITFKDTILRYNGGYYAVSVFPDVTNPFSQPPIRSDSLAVTISNGVASAYYNMSGLATGNYYVGATWIRSSDGSKRGVLGTYGCDTVVGCTSHIRLTVPSYAGTGNINFYSWTDTTRRLYP